MLRFFVAACVFIVPLTLRAEEPTFHLQAFVDGRYSIDWSLVTDPSANRKDIPHRGLDTQADLSLNLAGLDIIYAYDALGVQVDLRVGSGARAVVGQTPQNDLSFITPTQAYGFWQPSERFALDIGLFNTIYGNESADRSFLNRNYTRSVARTLFQPLQHVGIRSNIVLSPKFGLTFLLDHGGGLALDNNAYPSLGAQIYTTLDWLDVYVGYYGGPTESKARFEEFGHLVDIILDAHPLPMLVFQSDITFGKNAPNAPSPNAEYWALSGIIGLDINRYWRISTRFEHVIDTKRAKTKLYDRLSVGTLTLDILPTPNVILRAETRLEFANTSIFASSDSPQDTRYWIASILNATFHLGYPQ